MMPVAAPETPDVPSAGHGDPPAVTRKRTQRSGAIGLIGVAIVIVGMIFGYVINRTQDQQITTNADDQAALTTALNQQNAIISQVCQLAGGQVNRSAQAAQACNRVASGQPAVPAPAAATGAQGLPGTPGLGIDHVEQDGTCYINVILTNHSTSRFGPFCGADGAAGATGPSGDAGPTGETGPSGANGADGKDGVDGQPGAQGVGIASITDSSDRCYVTVALTNNTTQTIGPFCGSPATEIIMTMSNGDVQDCPLSGGSDSQPEYSCSVPSPTTTDTGAPPT